MERNLGTVEAFSLLPTRDAQSTWATRYEEPGKGKQWKVQKPCQRNRRIDYKLFLKLRFSIIHSLGKITIYGREPGTYFGKYSYLGLNTPVTV